jgi:hypothetical protein
MASLTVQSHVECPPESSVSGMFHADDRVMIVQGIEHGLHCSLSADMSGDYGNNRSIANKHYGKNTYSRKIIL